MINKLKLKVLTHVLNIDWSVVSLAEFLKGMEVEKEHKDVTNGSIVKTAKIVLAHLKEVPDYYTKLQVVEHK